MIQEVENYFKAVQDLKDVSKGGKDWAACSFMDISIRMDREKEAKEKAIIALGTIELEKILNSQGENHVSK